MTKLETLKSLYQMIGELIAAEEGAAPAGPQAPGPVAVAREPLKAWHQMPPAWSPAIAAMTPKQYRDGQATTSALMALYSYANDPFTPIEHYNTIRDQGGPRINDIPAEFIDKPYSFLIARFLNPGDARYMSEADKIRASYPAQPGEAWISGGNRPQPVPTPPAVGTE